MKLQRQTIEIQHLLPRIRKILEQIYGDRLKEVILYGSFARNNSTSDSDIDIAVVLHGKVNRTKEIDRIYDMLYDLMLETNELISVYPMSDEEMRNVNWPLYDHILNDGIKV